VRSLQNVNINSYKNVISHKDQALIE